MPKRLRAGKLFLKEGEVYNEIKIKGIFKKKVSIIEADCVKEASF